MKNKRTLISYLPLALSFVLAVLGFVLLPSRVAIQISFDGAIEKSDKIFSILFPFLISLAGSTMYLNFGKIMKKEISEGDLKPGIKYLVFSLVGVALLAYLLIRNLLFV